MNSLGYIDETNASKQHFNIANMDMVGLVMPKTHCTWQAKVFNCMGKPEVSIPLCA